MKSIALITFAVCLAACGEQPVPTTISVISIDRLDGEWHALKAGAAEETVTIEVAAKELVVREATGASIATIATPHRLHLVTDYSQTSSEPNLVTQNRQGITCYDIVWDDESSGLAMLDSKLDGTNALDALNFVLSRADGSRIQVYSIAACNMPSL